MFWIRAVKLTTISLYKTILLKYAWFSLFCIAILKKVYAERLIQMMIDLSLYWRVIDYFLPYIYTYISSCYCISTWPLCRRSWAAASTTATPNGWSCARKLLKKRSDIYFSLKVSITRISDRLYHYFVYFIYIN